MNSALNSSLIGASVALMGGVLTFVLLNGVKAAKSLDARKNVVGPPVRSSLTPFVPYIRLVAAFLKGSENMALGRDIKQRLATIGNPLQLTPPELLALCLIGGAASSVAAVLLAFALRIVVGVPLVFGLILCLFVGVAGLVVPYQQLSARATARVRSINRALPYAIDLMLLMLEAGANILEAIETVAKEGSYGPLGEELALVSRGMQHGESLTQALNGLSERIPSDDLNVIIRAITQGLTLGTPLTQALRDQADLLRLKRTQNAEKLGKEAGSRMALPIMLIMMATFLLVLGPAAMKFSELFSMQ